MKCVWNELKSWGGFDDRVGRRNLNFLDFFQIFRAITIKQLVFKF
jgi:hypothetical protein